MCSDWYMLQEDALNNRGKSPSHGRARGEVPQVALWAGSRAFSGGTGAVGLPEAGGPIWDLAGQG